MFTAQAIPDVTGKVFVITGGNSGIGFEAARVLLGKGGRVVLACRDPKKMREAADSLRAEHKGALVDELVLDLSSLVSVHTAAGQLGNLHARVDVLINNAGVMALPERTTTDGFEMQFGTNHLGHFAFTGLVLPLVTSSPAGRVVTVSSILHRGGVIDFASIPKPARYNPNTAYSMSKLANLLFTYELERRLMTSSASPHAYACHPGYSATNLQGVGPQMEGSALKGLMMKVANAVLAQPAAMGALPTLMAATSTLPGGSHVGPTGLGGMRGAPEIVKSSPASYDVDVAKRLWEVSERLTGVTFAFAKRA